MKKLLFVSVIAVLFALGFVSNSWAVYLDLTTHDSGTINGALFSKIDQTGTGTGALNSFLRIQETGQGDGIEEGYNTDGIVQFDTKDDPHTHSLLLSSVPLVNINGTNYREFILDGGEGGDKLVSLDEIQLQLHSFGDLTEYGTLFNAPLFDMDTSIIDGNSTIKLSLKGNGQADMYAYIPDSLFTDSTANPYLYFYSQFGENITADGTFEEWAWATWRWPSRIL